MSRNVLQETDYTFNPSTYTLTINERWIRPERIMLITNVTRNVTLYNFSDPSTSYTSVTSVDNGTGILSTVIVLNPAKFSGATMLSTDNIQVYVDEYAQTITPDETLTDGAQKQRVSTPQSLIDTDFEYSVQPSKWESIFLTSNYPSFFAKPNGGNSISATSIYGDGTSPRSIITVTASSPHGLLPGQVVNVQETQNYRVEGTFQVLSAPTIYTFTYRARGVVSGETIYQNDSVVYGGDVFDGAHIPGGNFAGLGTLPLGQALTSSNTMNPWSASTDNGTPSTITVAFQYPHGIFPGATISISGTNSFDGDYVIKQVPTVNTLVFTAYQQYGSVSVPSTGRIITKSDGYVIHRPYDAGVAITTYNNVPGLQAIRQTRRYFRYQAGKAIQFSTGAKLTPTFNIDAISMGAGSVGLQTVTVTTLEDHGLQAGAVVYIENIQTLNSNGYNPYNGSFTVTSVTNSNVFQYKVTLTQAVSFSDLTPNGQSSYAHAVNWWGAETRSGMFDEQNGFFFAYDGQQLYVNRRHSEKVLSGRLNVTQYSPLITGIGTQFRKQIVAGQKIVIKGSSYLVTAISSDTQLYIAPAYKGVSQTGARATITQNIRVPQASWNMDKCDGTGPSGYNLDPKRMQMIYIDYSWYGAGTIRFGVRGPRGNIIYVHRIVNSNVNQLAYQKSGNLPARYEVDNSPITYGKMVAGGSGVLGSQLASNDTIMYVQADSIWEWATPGYILVKDDTNLEIMQISSIGVLNTSLNAYPITITQRRASVTLTYPDQPFTYSGTLNPVTFATDSSFTGTGGNAQVSVLPITQTCAPIIQHWGSSVVMDGGYQADLLPIFTAGMTKYQTVAAGVTRPLIAIRVAPTVDNAQARNFGIRELINRMALQLQSVGVQTNGSYRIDVILNPSSISYNTLTTTQLASTRTSVAGLSGQSTITIADAGLNTGGTTGLQVGMMVSGTGIGAGAYITAINGSVVYLSAANSTNVSGTITFTPQSGYTGLPNDWTRDSVGQSSLAQAIFFDNGYGQGAIQSSSAVVQGGDSIFSFFSENGGGSSNYNSSVYSLIGAKDIGNSYMSGNGNVSTPGFPNGPDVLVISATNIGASSSQISARVSWTEAQA
jgi:hypothetical protein